MEGSQKVSLKKPSDESAASPSAGEIYPQQNQPQETQQYQRQSPQQYQQAPQQPVYAATKFCKFCGQVINREAVICVHCGGQVEQLQTAPANQPIIINNNNNNNNNNIAAPVGKCKNKWVAVLLCLFLGELGAHRFYEGKILTGFLWFFTCGLFFVGWLVDLIILLCKPNPYYV